MPHGDSGRGKGGGDRRPRRPRRQPRSPDQPQPRPRPGAGTDAAVAAATAGFTPSPPTAPPPSGPAASEESKAIGGANVGAEEIATPAAPPTPIPGTFSAPGKGKARFQRSARFGGQPFGPARGGKLEKVIGGAGIGTTSPFAGNPVAPDEESPLARALSNVFRRS